ncbi:MAG: hypothetical protein MUE81_10955 [Thermoflexibacter sp.]|jgi:hypothetical protein|nr:hypothetical protein [Thermoflexibacter sp.]
MKRIEFIKKATGLTLLGFSSGLILPDYLLADTKKVKLIMPEIDIEFKIIPTDVNRWGWLVSLATKSLIGILAAKIVQKYTSDCICNGTTCYKSPSNYKNAEGIYGYENGSRFVKQDIDDSNVGFQNVSVPFLNSQNQYIGNIEGPFLAGMCWATENLNKKYSASQIRKILIPKKDAQNGGYRFDTDACHSTSYKTDYGTTQISYAPTGKKSGFVRVEAKDENDNLGWEQAYKFDYT